MKKLCVFFILFVFLGSAAWGEEYTWTGVEDNQWTNPENWIDEDGDVPDSYPGENPDAIAIFENSANVSLDDFLPELLDDLIVDTGVTLTLIAGNASGFDANALTIDGTLNLEGGNYSITNVITVGSDGVLNLGAQGITAGTINNDGIIDLGSHSITAVTINNNGTLRLVGDSNQFGNRTSMGGTVEFTGIGDMLAGISIFDDLLITGGDRVADAEITAINITVTNSGSLDMDNETLNVSGDITGFISDIGTLNLTGAGSQVINFGENTTIDTLNKTVAGLAVINDVLTVTGNVHVTNGTLTLGDDFETTSLEIFGGTVNLEGADNDITSVSIGSGTFNPGGSLSVLSLEVLGAAVITNGTSLAVTDLNISNASAGLTGEVQFGGGRVTLPDVSNIVITGVNGTTGALISGDKTITISTNGTVTLGTITGTGERSLSLAGSGNFNSGGNSFTDVTVESGADITLEGNALTCGILDNNGTLTLETQIISVTGAITNDGTINAGTQVITAETITNNASGTLILAGNANQLLLPGVHASMGGTVEYIGNGLTLAGITTFNNLLITSGTRDVAAAITVHDTAEIYSEINADSINIAGAATIGADITTSGVQTYNGTLTLTANVVTFEGSEVNFVNTVTGQDITVISAGNFTVGAGGLEASGTIDLTSSTGGISQAGIITADTLIAGADDGINLELNNNAAQVKLVNLTTGSIVYNSNRSGDVTITAFNDAAGEPVEITVSGNLVVDTVDTTNGISSLDSLTLTANSISHVAGEIIAADSINLYLEDETGMEFLEWTSTTESIFINTRTEKNIVYGSSNPIPGAVWINSAVPGSWDRLVLNSSGNANIFIVNVGVTSRILTAINNAAGDGFIQIRGNYDSSAALVLEPGAFGVQLDAGANVVLQNTLFNLSAPNRNLTLLGVNQTNASITAAGISLGGTINGTSPGNNSLTLDASYAASDNISVTGDVGNLVRLGDITITNSGIFSLTSSADIQLSGSFRQQNSGGTGSSNLESSITTTGGTGETISFDNRVILAAPTVTFTGSTGSLVRFGNTVTGHEIPRVLAVDTANARFENDVGVGIGGNIASVVVDGDSTISGNITTTAPAGQTYNGAVILAANVTFTGSPASAVRFGGTVNSAAVELPAPPIPRELTIANNASVEFNQAAGGENPLASVTVTGTAAISANITTTEEQDYAAVNLFGVTRTLTSTGGYVSASGVVSGDAGVIVRASQGITMSAANTLSGDVTLENNQTGQAVDGDIQFNNASDNINLIAHNDTIEGIIDIEHDGLLSIAGVSSREGEITLKGTEGIVIGSSINTSNGQVIADVNLESADGDITGNGVITAGKLTITAGGSIVLSSELNNVVTLEIPQAGGDVEFVNNGVLTVNAISTAENVEITAISGDIIISGNIGSSTTSVGIVKIVSGNAQNIRIDSTGSINSYSLILIAGEDDDSTGMVTINGNITVESPDGQIGDCYGNAALHIRAGTFEGSGDITLENDGWVCADLLELFDFGGDISPQHIHFHSRNHIVYSNRASSYFGTLIPDGYLYINAENENLGDDLQIISRDNKNIFVVDIPENSSHQANTRDVILTTGSGGLIEIWGEYFSSGELNLNPGNAGVWLRDADIKLVADKPFAVETITLGGLTGSTIEAQGITLGWITGRDNPLGENNSLELTVGSGGGVELEGGDFLDQLTVNGKSTITGNITSRGAQTFNGTITLAVVIRIEFSSNDGNITLEEVVTDGSPIEFILDAAAGDVRVLSIGEAGQRLGNITINANDIESGAIYSTGNIVVTGETIELNGAIISTITSNITLNGSTILNNDIEFSTGPNAGNISLTSIEGAAVVLAMSAGTGNVTVTGAVVIEDIEITSAANVTFQGAVTAKDIEITSANVIIQSAVAASGTIYIGNLHDFTVGASGSIIAENLLFVAGNTTNNGTITAGPVVDSIAIEFNGSYTASAAGTLFGSNDENPDILFNSDVTLGDVVLRNNRLVFAGSEPQNLRFAPSANPEVDGDVLVRRGSRLNVAGGIAVRQTDTHTLELEESGNDTVAAILDTSVSSWHIGSGDPLGNRFLGINGMLKLGTGSRIITNNFVLPGSPGPTPAFVVNNTGRAYINISGNASIAENVNLNPDGSVLPQLVLEMSGNGNETQSLYTDQPLGSLYVGVNSQTILSTNLNTADNTLHNRTIYFRGEVVIASVSFPAGLVVGNHDIVMYAGLEGERDLSNYLLAGADKIYYTRWEITSAEYTPPPFIVNPNMNNYVFRQHPDRKVSFRRDPSANYLTVLPGNPVFFEIAGNTLWREFECTEHGAVIQFSRSPHHHTVYNRLSILGGDGADNYITLTRLTEQSIDDDISVDFSFFPYIFDPKEPHSMRPPAGGTALIGTPGLWGLPVSLPLMDLKNADKREKSKFWNLSIINHPGQRPLENFRRIKIYFSHAYNTRIPVERAGMQLEVIPYYRDYDDPPEGFFNYDWVELRKILYSFTEDFSGNGRLDRIRVQTNISLNGNFDEFDIAVEGYEINRCMDWANANNLDGFNRGFQMVNDFTKTGSFDDDSFYIYLIERPYYDGGNTPLWSIIENRSLRDAVTDQSLIGEPEDDINMIPFDTIPPRIAYTLTLPGHPQTFVQMSKPVVSFTTKTSAVDQITGISLFNVDAEKSNGRNFIWEYFHLDGTVTNFTLPLPPADLSYLLQWQSSVEFDTTLLAQLRNISGDTTSSLQSGYFQINNIIDQGQRAMDWSDSSLDPTYFIYYQAPKYPLNWGYTEYAKVFGNNHLRELSPDFKEDELNAAAVYGAIPIEDVFMPPNRLLTAQMMTDLASPDRNVRSTVTPNRFISDPEGYNVIRRITDTLVSIPPSSSSAEDFFAWPVWARYQEKPNPESYLDIGEWWDQPQRYADDVIWTFDGTAYLEANNIVMQVNSALPNMGLELFWSANVPETLRIPQEAPQRGRSSGGLWLPITSDSVNRHLYSFAPLLSDGITGQVSASPSSSLPLVNFEINENDHPRFSSGQKLEFVFRFVNNTNPDPPSDMFITRLNIPPGSPIPENWFRLVRPFSFDIQDIRPQRGGVTILNNVINSNNREETYIRYHLVRPGRVTVQVYTLDGTLVRSIRRNEFRGAGTYTDAWDGSNNGGRPVTRGMYFVRVVGPDIDEIRKIMVVR